MQPTQPPARLATAGYSGRSVAEKLGLNDTTRLWVIDAPADYAELVGPLPPGLEWCDGADAQPSLIHLFVRRRADLAHHLTELRSAMAPTAVIWVSWPKKASGMVTDLSEDVLRAIALPLGLVDIKVCAVSAVWSGLKLMIRKALRGRGSA